MKEKSTRRARITTIAMPTDPRRLALLVGAAVIATVGVATASIPAADGTIKACYAVASGTARIVDSELTTCRSGERLLSWNQTGVQGPQGPQGLQGLQGPQGVAGANGTTVAGGQAAGGTGSTTGCHDAPIKTANIHLDKASTLHVEASAVATGHTGARVGQLVVTLETAGGSFGGELQGSQVPVGAGSALTTISGFVERFGVGAHTFGPGDYVLKLEGRALGTCDDTATEFATGAARLVWFTAQ